METTSIGDNMPLLNIKRLWLSVYFPDFFIYFNYMFNHTPASYKLLQLSYFKSILAGAQSWLDISVGLQWMDHTFLPYPTGVLTTYVPLSSCQLFNGLSCLSFSVLLVQICALNTMNLSHVSSPCLLSSKCMPSFIAPSNISPGKSCHLAKWSTICFSLSLMV